MLRAFTTITTTSIATKHPNPNNPNNSFQHTSTPLSRRNVFVLRNLAPNTPFIPPETETKPPESFTTVRFLSLPLRSAHTTPAPHHVECETKQKLPALSLCFVLSFIYTTMHKQVLHIFVHTNSRPPVHLFEAELMFPCSL